MGCWREFRLKDFVELNPRENLAKGTIAKKIQMDNLLPLCRDIKKYEIAAYLGGSKFRNDDTIMARITPCLENGKRAKVSILEEGEIGFGSTEYIVFRAKKGISDANFIYYLVCSDLVREPAIKSMVGSSGRQRVQLSVIENLRLMIPPLSVQKRIAAVLSALDDKIELNNKINQNLEQQAQAIFVHCFSIVNYGDRCIGDYIKPKRGRNLLSKFTIRGNVPVIAGGLMPAGYHNLSNTLAPVVTISASGANAGYINLWHVPVWSSDSSYIDIDVTPYVYFWFILLKRRQQEIFDSQVGSAQPHIYPKHIEALSLKKLDENLVSQYNNIVTPLFRCIGKNLKENFYLSQLRDTLLPKLMSGEIDVSRVNTEDFGGKKFGVKND